MFAFMDPPDDEAFVDIGDGRAARVLRRDLGGHPALAVVCGNQEVEEIAAMNGLAGRGLAGAALRQDRAHARRGPPARACPTSSSNPTGGRTALPDGHRRQPVLRRRRLPATARRRPSRRRPLRRRVPGLLHPARAAQHRGALSAAPTAPGTTRTGRRACTTTRAAPGTWRTSATTTSACSSARIRCCERYVDPERALDLGRATNAELMSRVFAEWRRAGSTCAGGLVLALADLRHRRGLGGHRLRRSPQGAVVRAPARLRAR